MTRGAPKGQKRITIKIARLFADASGEDRTALLNDFATFGKASPQELEAALVAKAADAPPPAARTDTASWFAPASSTKAYAALDIAQITRIRDAAQQAIDDFARIEKQRKLHEIQALEARLNTLKAELDN